MKILVVLTGGTIGSRTMGNIINVDSEAACDLIRLYEQKYGTETQFDVVQPINILSENLTPFFWNDLYACLSRVEPGKYDGIIIAHGSDTLAYTAAMIGFCFAHTPIPIVLTASNYPLQEAESNGLSNFYHGVCLIAEKKMTGVFVVYENNRKENIVYLATRLKEADTYLDQFSSYGGVDFGRMEGERFVRIAHPQNPALEELNASGKSPVVRNITFEKNILLIRPYPGLDYRHLALDHSVAAVLHCTYHAATVCSAKGAFSAVEFTNRCREKGIKVYACCFKNSGNLYATGRAFLDAGAIPLNNISTEAAYAKLTLAYNQQEIGPEQLMRQNIYYEILPDRESG